MRTMDAVSTKTLGKSVRACLATVLGLALWLCASWGAAQQADPYAAYRELNAQQNASAQSTENTTQAVPNQSLVQNSVQPPSTPTMGLPKLNGGMPTSAGSGDAGDAGISFNSGLLQGLGPQGTNTALTVSATLVPPADSQPGMISITAEIPAGWHIYSTTQQDGGPVRTLLHLPMDKIKLAGGIRVVPQPKIEKDPAVWGDLQIETHEGRVTWHVPFVWKDKQFIGSPISGSVEAQMCDVNACLEPKKFKFTAHPVASFPGPAVQEQPVSAQATPAQTSTEPPASAPSMSPLAVPSLSKLNIPTASDAIPAESTPEGHLATDASNAPQTDASADSAQSTAPSAAEPTAEQATTEQATTEQSTTAETTPTEEPSQTTAGQSDRTLWVWLLFAYLGGLILNLMPCVLPVIAPKLYSFMHQAGESRWRIFQLNLSYVFGLLTVLWILAACSRIQDLLRWLATILPTSMASHLPAAQNMGWGEQYTYPGFVIFMISLVFVMGLSFLGTWEIPIPGFVAGGKLGEMQRKEGPFGAYCMGILTTILATPCVGPFLGPVFGAVMNESVGVSFLTFTVIGLGLATPYLLVGLFPSWVKFLPKPGAWMETLKEIMAFFFFAIVVWQFYVLPSKYVVPTLALLVALWFACWLIGKVSYSGAAMDKILTTWCIAVALVTLFGVGFFHFWFTEHKLEWQKFSPELVQQLREEDKIVFIDFTANWCFTCKTNTLVAIEKQNVAEFVHQHQIVPVLADWTNRSEDIRNYLQSLGRNSIPLVVIWKPGQTEPILLDGLITEGQLLDALEQATK